MTIQRMEQVGNVRGAEGIIVGLAEQDRLRAPAGRSRLFDASGRPGAGSAARRGPCGIT